jgi:hypothetical protein
VAVVAIRRSTPEVVDQIAADDMLPIGQGSLQQRKSSLEQCAGCERQANVSLRHR